MVLDLLIFRSLEVSFHRSSAVRICANSETNRSTSASDLLPGLVRYRYKSESDTGRKTCMPSTAVSGSN